MGARECEPPPPCLIGSVELDSNKQESLLSRLHMHCAHNFLQYPFLRNYFHEINWKGIDALSNVANVNKKKETKEVLQLRSVLNTRQWLP